MNRDLAKLQGTWHVTALETDGGAAPPEVFTHATITLDGTGFTSSGMGADYRGTVTLGATKTHKTIDLAFTEGPPAGMTNRGIYAIDGDGWRMCLATNGDARPRSFRTKPTSGYVLETFARERRGERGTQITRLARDDNSRARDDSKACEIASEIDGEWAMTAGVFSGAPLSPDMVKWCKRSTRDGVTRILAAASTMLDASFTIDPTRGHIDYVNRSGKHKGKAQAGIYERRGETLRICTAAPGAPRPDAFSSTKGDGRSFTEWTLLTS